MTGADVPALRALAGQMSASAARLDGMRQSVRARLYSINWQGPDGADFRRAWDGQHAPMLSRVAEGLRASAQNLLREAAQQEAASGSNGGLGAAAGALVGSGARDDGFGPARSFNKAYDLFLGLSGGFMKLMETLYSRKVRGHWRQGDWINDYHRWARGKADSLNGTLGSAKQVVKFGKFVPFLGGVSAGVDQWLEDEEAQAQPNGPTFRPGEQRDRAIASGVVMTGVDWATDLLIVGGVAVGGPVGGVIGYGLATGISMAVEDPVTDAVSWGVSRAYDAEEILDEFAYDAGQAAVDFGSDVLGTGRDVLRAGGEVAEDAGEAVGNFITGVTSWAR